VIIGPDVHSQLVTNGISPIQLSEIFDHLGERNLLLITRTGKGTPSVTVSAAMKNVIEQYFPALPEQETPDVQLENSLV
jgi:hypothetical protein